MRRRHSWRCPNCNTSLGDLIHTDDLIYLLVWRDAIESVRPVGVTEYGVVCRCGREKWFSNGRIQFAERDRAA